MEQGQLITARRCGHGRDAALTDVGQTGPVDARTSLAGRYRILDRLGVGGMSVVWRAHDAVLDRVVAVKVLAPGQLVDAAARARVQTEARAAAALSHPNVAAVHDYGQTPGPSGEPVPYVVMELVDGPSLTDVLADGPLDPAEAMRICADVARGLAAAHARGLVHRDVKPGNVIVTADGAKLVDFGIAAAIGAPDEADDDGVMLGTPAYLAPERLEDGVVVPGSDVYALGLLMYRLLAGTTPWSAQTTTQMLKAHAYLPPRPLPATGGVPAEVADLCQRCLAKNPADRPSAAEVAAMLTSAGRAVQPAPAATAGTAGGAARGFRVDEPKPDGAGSAGGQTSPDPAGHRRRRLTILAAVVAVLVAGLFLLSPWLLGWRPGQRDADDHPPAVGGVPVLEAPSFPNADTDTRSGGPANGAPPVGPGGTPAGTGAGGAVGTPGGPPAGATTGPSAGGATPPGAPGATATPNPTRRSVDTAGGSAVVECTGTLAHLIDWTPAEGYQTQAVQPGPNPSVQVTFRAGKNHVSIHAECANGVPDITVR